MFQDMEYEDFQDDLSFRDLLALDRTILANERTALAYARTAVMLVVTAVTLLKIFPENLPMRVLAIVLLPIAIFVSVVGVRRYVQLSRSLAKRRTR